MRVPDEFVMFVQPTYEPHAGIATVTAVLDGPTTVQGTDSSSSGCENVPTEPGHPFEESAITSPPLVASINNATVAGVPSPQVAVSDTAMPTHARVWS
jgi:hypothetical protein